MARRGNTVAQAALIGLATTICVGYVVVATGLLQVPFTNGIAQEQKSPSGAGPSSGLFKKLNLFKDWNKPSVVILLSGETHGYLQPCGCSDPQYGGLTRRYNLVEMMK